ncbi:MAG: methionyl-tRNA formyltransferase [Francisellaceae bacterium]|jgi:methionyl-tRNA formyltransferase
MKPLNIAFAGTPEIAATTLEHLIQSQHNIIAVYTQPDRPAGRGKKPKPSEVKVIAEQNNLPVFQPLSFKKSPESVAELKNLKPDVMIVIAYGLLLPKAVLDIPKLGCINIHVSLLPKYRGAAPIQRAILNGDKETGITMMRMDEGLDTGDILTTETMSIGDNETSAELHDRIAQQSGPLLVSTLEGLLLNKITPTKQSDGGTYAHKIQKSEGSIDWKKTAQEIHNKIRGFQTWPSAFTNISGQTVKIIQSEPSTQTTNNPPGTIISIDKTGFKIQTSENIINITKLQFPGKKAMKISDILNGRDLTPLINTTLT